MRKSERLRNRKESREREGGEKQKKKEKGCENKKIE